MSYEPVVSYRKPAMGGPTMAARPREMQIIPKHFVSATIPNKSTRTIDVSAIKAAEKKKKNSYTKRKK